MTGSKFTFFSTEDKGLHHPAAAYLFPLSPITVPSWLASHQHCLWCSSLHTMLFLAPRSLITLLTLLPKHILPPSNYCPISSRKHSLTAPPHLIPAELDASPLCFQSTQCKALSAHLRNCFITFCLSVCLNYMFELLLRQCLYPIFFHLVSPEPSTVPGPS